MKPRDTMIHVKFPADDKKALRKYAASRHMTVSEVVRQMFYAAIAQQSKERAA